MKKVLKFVWWLFIQPWWGMLEILWLDLWNNFQPLERLPSCPNFCFLGNFPGNGIRNKQVSDTEFFYKFSNLRKGIHTKLDFR